jgi:hypothetical protein
MVKWHLNHNVFRNVYLQRAKAHTSVLSEFSIVDGKVYGSFDPQNGHHLEKILPYKDLYFLEMWNLEHPDSTFRDYKLLLEFINRSKELQQWYKKVTSRYSYLNELPSWVLLDDVIRELWVTDSSTIFTKHKSQRKAIVAEREKLFRSVEESIEKLDTEEKELLDSFYRKHPIVAINKIPIQGIPADRLLRHSDKNGAALEVALKDELDTYKQELTSKYVVGDSPIQELLDLLFRIL